MGAGLTNIYSAPSRSTANDWCDYLELLCFINENREISIGDAEDAISDDGIGHDNLESTIESSRIIDELVDDVDEFVEFGEESEDDPEDNIGSSKPNLEDLFSSRLEEFFVHLSYRSDHYADTYPFDIDLINSKIHLKPSTIPRKFYLMLTVSSSLKYAENYMSDLTGLFELVGKKIIENALPQGAKVEIYGKNVSGLPTPFTGSEFGKLVKLGNALNIPLKPNANLNYINKYSTGDNGLDVVGYVDYNDGNPGSEIIFAQCACGKAWIYKQFEVSSVRWSNYLDFVNLPTPYIIIPRNLRDTKNNWENPLDIYETVPIDRFRICTTLSSNQVEELFSQYESYYTEIYSNTIDAFD